jgi:hypothetical protein
MVTVLNPCIEEPRQTYAGTIGWFSRLGGSEGASMSEFAGTVATSSSLPFTLSEPLAPTTSPEFLPQPVDNAVLPFGERGGGWPLFMIGAGVLLTLAWTMFLAWKAVPIVGMLGRVVFELVG